MYFVIAASVVFYSLLFDVLIPEWLLILAAILFIAGIVLFIIAEKE